jgi:adenine deaminase
MDLPEDKVQGMIDESIRKAINQHNRNATLISMMLGFTFMALFVDGLLRVLGVIPPFLNIDINIVDQIVGKVKARI